MATAQTLTDRAMRLLGQLPSGSSGTTNESADGLTALNAMIESWRNEGLMAYALQEETVTLPASTVSRTVGPSGNLVTTRPVEVVQAWVNSSSIDYDIEILTREKYSEIPDKAAVSSWPTKLAYEPAMPDGIVYFYPLASASTTVKLLTRVPVTAFAASSTTVSLPPGWEQALAYNLAVTWAPEFETQASPDVVAEARRSKAVIKVANSKPIPASTELSYLVGRGRRSNIITGQP